VIFGGQSDRPVDARYNLLGGSPTTNRREGRIGAPGQREEFDVMAQGKEVTLHRLARRACDALSVSERMKVERALALLSDPTTDDFVRANVRRLNTPDPTYLMRATPKIRILFNKSSDGIQVLDVVYRDKLRSFREMAGADEVAVARRTSRKAAVRPHARRWLKRKRKV